MILLFLHCPLSLKRTASATGEVNDHKHNIRQGKKNEIPFLFNKIR